MKGRPFRNGATSAAVVAGSILACLLSSCGIERGSGLATSESVLQMTGMASGKNAVFNDAFMKSFGKQNHIRTQYLTDFGGTVNNRLAMYQQLLAQHSSKPDLLEVDVVWPAILADDLIDLKPYFGDEIKKFVPEAIANNTVDGRLIALPSYIDVGVLYYRPQLLTRYGFTRPPSTWDELSSMARTIQAGERRRGNKTFWGFTWQGGSYEGLTCDALEWQASAGAGNPIQADKTIHVRNPAFLAALRRAADWIGVISPPGESVYVEHDTENLWSAGQVAFMRAWASSYDQIASHPGGDAIHFGVAPVPAGRAGSRATLGGMGVGISKYAINRALAVKALRELTSEESDLRRVMMADSIPVRLSVRDRPDVQSKSELHAAADKLLAGLVARPSLVTGRKI